MELAAFSAGAATVLSALQLLPQVRKLLVSPATVGLSPTWVVLGLGANGGWVVYRWSQELWLAIASPLIAAGLYVATLILMGRRSDMGWAQRAAATWCACAAAAGLVGGWPLVGTLLAATAVVQAVPSLWSAFRSPRPDGIAPGVWLIGLGQAVLWGHYGLSMADQALLTYGVAVSVASGVMLGRYGWTRYRVVEAAA